MMYRNNFVVVIKNKGKVLRESTSGVVRLPFGSDYSVLLKNKDSRKAVADVEIDGEDVATGIIVPGNSSVELKGALNGLSVRKHFRFIRKTKEISNYRGDRPDDGLVRVEYKFERYEEVVHPIKPLIKKSNWEPLHRVDWTYTDNNTSAGDVYYGSNAQNCFYSSINDGITVPGKDTRQDFEYGWTKPLESQSHVIILQLRGLTKKRKRVKKPITVKTKLRCPTCGRRSKSSMKFCGGCGTNLR